MTKLTAWCAVALVACALSACRSKSPTVLSDNACAYPCWQGIAPGKTTRQDALTILSSLSSVHTVTEGKLNDRRTTAYASFVPGYAESGLRIYFIGELALALEFDVAGVFTVAEAIALTAEPEWIFAYSDCADRRWLVIGLLNISRGFYIEHTNLAFQAKDLAQVTAKDRVQTLIYFDPLLYDELLKSFSVLNYRVEPARYASTLTPWTGYGEVPYIELCQ